MVISHYASWVSQLYVITHDSITEVFGLIFKSERTYLIRNIMEIRLNQGILGKIFHFGTILISTQLKEETIKLKNIMNPNQNIAALKLIATKNKESVAFV